MGKGVAGGIFSGINASIVEVYEAGRLGESWSTQPGLNVEDLRKKSTRVARYQRAIRQRHPGRLHRAGAILSLFKDMLSKLPLEERNSLNFGTVELR